MARYEVGFDVEAALRRVVRHAQLRIQDEERRKRVDAQHHTYDTPETYYCLVQRVNPGAAESVRPIYEATTLQEVPGVGVVKGQGHTPEAALVEVRFQLAQQWARLRIEPDYDAARARACKVRLERELFL